MIGLAILASLWNLPLPARPDSAAKQFLAQVKVCEGDPYGFPVDRLRVSRKGGQRQVLAERNLVVIEGPKDSILCGCEFRSENGRDFEEFGVRITVNPMRGQGGQILFAAHVEFKPLGETPTKDSCLRLVKPGEVIKLISGANSHDDQTWVELRPTQLIE